jgi:hypothetical protein
VISYRFRRRSFLAGIGGALGLEMLLQNLEASAEGAKPPPRLLVLHWPRGVVRADFVPTGTGASYVASALLAPFEPVRSEMLALYGLTHRGIGDGGGTPHDAGLVRTMTGANSPGRASTFEVIAGGPSWDQIFLENVTALARRDGAGIVGRGYHNAIGDIRFDSSSPGGRALSYGYDKVNVMSASGVTLSGNRQLRPVASALTLYNDLFSNYMPGAVPPGALKALSMKKSVLDSALRELARVRELAPASERPKLDAHEETIRRMEAAIAGQMGGMGPGAMLCTVPPVPPVPGPEKESPTHEQYAQTTLAHADVLRAAFACDLIRVATLQFAAATHDPAADALGPDFFAGPPPAATSEGRAAYESASDLARFYFDLAAQIVARFKEQIDAFEPLGDKLLARTLIPLVTEVSDCGHSLDRLPAFVFGGSRLGMQGGRFESFESNPQPMNDFWLTLAQPLLGTSEPLAALAAETFVKDGARPIPGLWSPPA